VFRLHWEPKHGAEDPVPRWECGDSHAGSACRGLASSCSLQRNGGHEVLSSNTSVTKGKGLWLIATVRCGGSC
jgi:hypothetical protein